MHSHVNNAYIKEITVLPVININRLVVALGEKHGIFTLFKILNPINVENCNYI